MPDKGDGDGSKIGEVGDMSFGVCTVDELLRAMDRELISEMFVVDALRVSFPLTTPCLCLNLVTQLALPIFAIRAWSPTEEAKNLAFSASEESVISMPSFC